MIDGYNLLHALRSRGSKSISRERLLAWTAEFASFKKTPVLIVLDGVGDDQELAAYSTAYFEAVFSQKVPADTYIERFLFQHRETKRMTVVTDDNAIANIGRGGGAQVLGTSYFAEMLKECKSEGSDILKKEQSKGHGFNRPFGDKLKDL